MKIQTERCLIRYFKEEDIDDFIVYRNDMNWMKYQGFKGLSKQEYSDVLLGEHILQDGVQLAIICQKTNTLIGDVYLRQEEDVVWIGYSICPTMSRQGYAYEVISAVITFLREKGITSIKAGIETGNVASFALINKLNFCYVEMDGNEQIFALEL